MNLTTCFTEEMVPLAKNYCDDPDETAALEGGGSFVGIHDDFPPRAANFP